MSELVIRIPDENEPGFLRRDLLRVKYVSLNEQAQKNPGLQLEAAEARLEWILVYVEQPADKDEARELLLDLSVDEFTKIIDKIVNTGQLEKKVSE